MKNFFKQRIQKRPLFYYYNQYMMDDSFSKIIGIEEAANLSSLSKRHIRLLLESGKIIGKKIGRDWITTKEEVEKYINSKPKPGPKKKSH